jgi:soluble lytic murein transglycosylase-like protein
MAKGLSRRAAAIAGLLLAASPARADPVARWQAYIDDAAHRFGVPAGWIVRVMRAESAGLTRRRGRPIVSRAGAIGLMQLMPATWIEMRQALGLGADPHDPHDNILAGAYYLKLMHRRFGYPGLFAAYNAGPGRYAAQLATGQRLPGETRAYLAALAGGAAPLEADVSAPPPSLFFTLGGAATRRSPSAGLFVPLGAESARP